MHYEYPVHYSNAPDKSNYSNPYHYSNPRLLIFKTFSNLPTFVATKLPPSSHSNSEY